MDDGSLDAIEDMQEMSNDVDLGMDENEKSKDSGTALKVKNSELNALELSIQKINKQREFFQLFFVYIM